jgi:hypothetical protein
VSATAQIRWEEVRSMMGWRNGEGKRGEGRGEVDEEGGKGRVVNLESFSAGE